MSQAAASLSDDGSDAMPGPQQNLNMPSVPLSLEDTKENTAPASTPQQSASKLEAQQVNDRKPAIAQMQQKPQIEEIPLLLDPIWVRDELRPMLAHAFSGRVSPYMDWNPIIQAAVEQIDNPLILPIANTIFPDTDFTFNRLLYALTNRHLVPAADIFQPALVDMDFITRFFVRHYKNNHGPYPLISRGTTIPSSIFDKVEQKHIAHTVEVTKGTVPPPYVQLQRPTVSAASPTNPAAMDPRLLFAVPGEMIDTTLRSFISAYDNQNLRHKYRISLTPAAVLNEFRRRGIDPVNLPAGLPHHEAVQVALRALNKNEWNGTYIPGIKTEEPASPFKPRGTRFEVDEAQPRPVPFFVGNPRIGDSMSSHLGADPSSPKPSDFQKHAAYDHVWFSPRVGGNRPATASEQEKTIDPARVADFMAEVSQLFANGTPAHAQMEWIISGRHASRSAIDEVRSFLGSVDRYELAEDIVAWLQGGE